MNSTVSIGERIKDLRGKIPQADLAELLGISRNTYRRLESTGAFSIEQINTLADFFEVTADLILNGEQQSLDAFPIETPGNIKDARLFSSKFSIYDDIKTTNLKEEYLDLFASLDEKEQIEVIEFMKDKLEKK